ncbi:Glycerol uptake operon antiterminator regulatory protein [bioreactor metagenome]|uniref:Glycerol uptake operon antiterminator regulatory protein n=1 Tax=bioreactor metagenome TaxID=1076179 RepID=A0A645E4M2_9ZZZZ
MIHIDLLEGIGKDRAGFTCLARLGVTAIITTKIHIAKLAREHGMIVIQRLFIVDSEAVRTGIKMANHFKPDAIEVLPSTVPERVVKTFILETGLPILAGGCIYDEDNVKETLSKGVVAVSTHQRKLWV